MGTSGPVLWSGREDLHCRIRFGFTTTTYDVEGETEGLSGDVGNLNMEIIRRAAKRFVGVIKQTPPPFSAKKLGGIPAYKLARKQQPVLLKPAEITVYSLETDDGNGKSASFRLEVSSGT
jgi:tRNA pseudouridine55 synthase